MLALIVLAAIATVAFLIFSQKRASLFVRAYLYLISLEEGLSSEDANRVAMTFRSKPSDADQDNRVLHAAKLYARVKFGGKQIPVIDLARRKGFLG